MNEHSIYLSNEDRKRSAFSSPDAHFTKRNELGFWVRRSVSSKPVMPPDTTLLDGDPEAEEVEWLKKQFQPTDMVNKGTAIKIQVSVPRALHWNALVRDGLLHSVEYRALRLSDLGLSRVRSKPGITATRRTRCGRSGRRHSDCGRSVRTSV